MAALVTAVGTGIQVTKIVKRNERDQARLDKETPKSFAELTEISEILACLIAGVYAHDKGDIEAPQYWTGMGFEPLNLDFDSGEVVGADLQEGRKVVGDLAKDSRAPKARLVFFQRSQIVPVHKVENLPKYVIAIRGTIKTRYDDYRAGLKIMMETLHEDTHLYEPIVRLILAIYEHHGHVQHVCVAGYSLGAALALLATRRLALEHEISNLETHLFNPPFLTSDVLLKKVAMGVVNGVSDAASMVTRSCRVKGFVRATGAAVAGICDSAVRHVAEKVPSVNRHNKQMESECKELQRKGYVPNLYLNPKDTVCNEYLSYFSKLGSSVPPFASTASSFVFKSRSNHLIPAANLHINHWAEGFYEAHKLHQWYRYPTLNLEFIPAGEIGESEKDNA